MMFPFMCLWRLMALIPQISIKDWNMPNNEIDRSEKYLKWVRGFGQFLVTKFMKVLELLGTLIWVWWVVYVALAKHQQTPRSWRVKKLQSEGLLTLNLAGFICNQERWYVSRCIVTYLIFLNIIVWIIAFSVVGKVLNLILSHSSLYGSTGMCSCFE